MKPANKIIIYDDCCPMCSAYTKTFVRAGLIQSSGRKTFSEISTELLEKLDMHKCRNEIPLIDISTNEVKYGIDSLLDILGQKWPAAKRVGEMKPVKWFLKRLYNLVSYNRRVVTATKSSPGNFDCAPEYNLKYRLMFFLLGLFFNTLMLIPEYKLILGNSRLNNASLMQLQVAHFVFVTINFCVAFSLHGRKGMEFLGQANMLALLTTLLLLPLMMLNSLAQIPSTLNNTYLIMLLVFILTEYRRRMSYAEMLPGHKKILLINIFSAVTFLLYLAT